jgi:phytoene dehydrogenase-like protein
MRLTTHDSGTDLIVIGGGLAGLAAATLVALGGRSVLLLERARELGGRAATHVEEDIHFNLGPHALYCRGRAFRLFRELGIAFKGGFPRAQGGLLAIDDAMFPLPRGILSLVASRLFTPREKLKALRVIGTLDRLETRQLDRISLNDWIEQTSGSGNLARLLRTLIRVSTYSDDAERISAGAALDQLNLALKGNVWYLDGGWQTLVNGLRDRAIAHGATLRTGARVDSVRNDGNGVSVQLAGGERLRCRAAVLAVGPETACDLLDPAADSPVVRWTKGCIPIRAACLDVALSRLPRPDRCVAFGLDRPLYYSVHSASAELAPRGVSVLHVMKNLAEASESTPEATRAELEGLLERLQPGWRDHVVARRFLPGMTVAFSLPLAQDSGLQGRPDVAVPGVSNVFLAGDWVGREGMLADASAASASEAAGRVLEVLSKAPALADGSLAHATN